MSKQTYSQMTKQIAKLQAQAEAIKNAEKRGVIGRIREAISSYGITARELFGTMVYEKSALKSKSRTKRAAKFADGKGNEWVGRGPRPQWLRDAMTAGKNLEDFAIRRSKLNGSMKSAAKKATKKALAKRVSSKASKKPLPAKYKDGAGNSWTGRGSQPKWLKAALADGKTLEELRA